MHLISLGSSKKSKKWKPDCAATETPAMHPFKKPDEYAACMEVGSSDKEVVESNFVRSGD